MPSFMSAIKYSTFEYCSYIKIYFELGFRDTSPYSHVCNQRVRQSARDRIPNGTHATTSDS